MARDTRSAPLSADREGLDHRELLALAEAALAAAQELQAAAHAALGRRVLRSGRVDPEALRRQQFAAHGFAWVCTYVEALAQLLAWARRLADEERLGELEGLLLQAGFGEYLAQLAGGIALSQGEIVRPADLGLDPQELAALDSPEARKLITRGNTSAVRTRIAALLDADHFGDPGLRDGTHTLIQGQLRRFGRERVTPFAQDWHRADRLIPDELLEEMGELGVFGLTVPERWGGLGMGKVAMCIVSEELSRGYLGVGSLGTRSEIAAELIGNAGTEAQKQRWLPGIAAGTVLPAAVFTEPDVGSDLAQLRTRAVPEEGGYRISGSKTWSTHAARADLLTLLARTGTPASGYRGLSMFLAAKPRGTDSDAFPIAGLSGSTIPVLGYRGMKEYTLAFDGFAVPADALLGGTEGAGFKQLMATFESARIQTAARAVGVAQNALDLALAYARERRQFGRAIGEFPRIAGKIAWMAVETMLARQLTWHAAREKDSGRRCDVEAGMAKLLGARVAWSNADNAVQVHGGNGYAEEYPVSRVLVDARILNIFEGAAEIQADVIARRLLEQRN